MNQDKLHFRSEIFKEIYIEELSEVYMYTTGKFCKVVHGIEVSASANSGSGHDSKLCNCMYLHTVSFLWTIQQPKHLGMTEIKT